MTTQEVTVIKLTQNPHKDITIEKKTSCCTTEYALNIILALSALLLFSVGVAGATYSSTHMISSSVVAGGGTFFLAAALVEFFFMSFIRRQKILHLIKRGNLLLKLLLPIKKRIAVLNTLT